MVDIFACGWPAQDWIYQWPFRVWGGAPGPVDLMASMACAATTYTWNMF